MLILTRKLVPCLGLVLVPAAAVAQRAPTSPVSPEVLRRDWSRDVLRPRAGESFAPGDCGTAVDRGARALDRLGRFATAYVRGTAVEPLRPLPASSDGAVYRARCGRMRVLNPRALDAASELDLRREEIDRTGRSSASTGLPQGLRGSSGRVGAGGAAIAGVGALIFGSTGTGAEGARRRGVVRWSIKPFMMGGGVGLTLVGYAF